MKRSLSSILFVVTVVVSCSALSQNDTNLVVNPGFEEHSACPEEMLLHGEGRKLTELNSWHIANKGTTDYFQVCSGPEECGVPENMWGYQPAHSGNAYVGLVATGGGLGGKNYREYIQSELKDTLIGGQEYYAEFYVSLAEVSGYTANTLGIYVSRSRIQGHSIKVIGYDSRKKAERRRKALNILDPDARPDTFYKLEYLLVEPVTPQVKMTEFIADTMNWVKVSGTFIAEGGEKYITIGSFEKTIKKKDGRNREKIKLRGDLVRKKHARNALLTRISKTAYYYLDDVLLKPVYRTVDSVVAEAPLEDTIPNMENQLLNEGKYILQNVHFDTDKYIIRENSFDDLDNLIVFMQNHPEIKILIAGHTDNTGDAEHNLQLSLKRANAVREYLIQNGIEPSRMQTQGFGNTDPIASNDTEAGRQRNRRVETIVIDGL